MSRSRNTEQLGRKWTTLEVVKEDEANEQKRWGWCAVLIPRSQNGAMDGAPGVFCPGRGKAAPKERPPSLLVEDSLHGGSCKRTVQC